MEPSRRNLCAAIAVVFLLAMAADDVARVQAEQFCYYLSGTFHGFCVWPSDCANTCRKEASPQRPGHNYAGGTCMDSPNRKCYCSEPCLKKQPSGATAMPAGGQGGDGAWTHD